MLRATCCRRGSIVGFSLVIDGDGELGACSDADIFRRSRAVCTEQFGAWCRSVWFRLLGESDPNVFTRYLSVHVVACEVSEEVLELGDPLIAVDVGDELDVCIGLKFDDDAGFENIRWFGFIEVVLK